MNMDNGFILFNFCFAFCILSVIDLSVFFLYDLRATVCKSAIKFECAVLHAEYEKQMGVI